MWDSYIIAFGNGSCPNLRGDLPAPSKRFLDHLKSLSRCNVQVSTVFIDEYLYLTSVCGIHKRTLVNLRERSKSSMSSGASGQKIHAVLKYTSYNTVWNQDVMAAKNMRHTFVYMALNNNERPDPFNCPDTTNAEEGTGPRQVPLSAG